MPESIIGVPHVVAVCPDDLEIAKVPEDSDSLLLRLASEDEVSRYCSTDQRLGNVMLAWSASRTGAPPVLSAQRGCWALQGSRLPCPQLSRLMCRRYSAGGCCVQASMWLQHLLRSQQTLRMLAGTAGAEAADSGELPDSASVASGGDASGQPSPASRQVKLSVTAQLGEVALFVSGRPADVWWPAEVPPAWLPPCRASLLATSARHS